MASAYVTNLPPPPYKVEMFKGGVISLEWLRWFQLLWQRTGGSTGDTIYDALDNAQASAASEAQLFATRAELESMLQGIVLQMIEQVRDTPQDLTAFITETPQLPFEQTPEATVVQIPFDQFPDDISIGGIIQSAIDNGKVSSVFGRTGAVSATEGDYSLTLLGDVTITSPSTSQGLIYNGTTWVNSAITATAFTGTLPVSNGGTGASTLTANNVILGNGTSAVSFVAPGASGNVLTSNGTTWTSAAPSGGGGATHPLGDRIVAAAAQTVFNTACATTANSGTAYYTQVTKNGLVLSEGAGNDYTVTGGTQITLTAGAALNDIITVRTWT